MGNQVERLTPIKPEIPSTHLDRVAGLGDYHREPVCGLYAVAFIVGEPVETIRHQYNEMFGPLSARWRGRTTFENLHEMLKGFEIDLEKLTLPGRLSVSRFCREEAVDKDAFLVRVGNHFMVICEGYAVDQYGVHRLGKGSKTDRRIISHAIKINGFKL